MIHACSVIDVLQVGRREQKKVYFFAPVAREHRLGTPKSEAKKRFVTNVPQSYALFLTCVADADEGGRADAQTMIAALNL